MEKGKKGKRLGLFLSDLCRREEYWIPLRGGRKGDPRRGRKGSLWERNCKRGREKKWKEKLKGKKK